MLGRAIPRLRKVRGPFRRTDRDGWWLEYSDYAQGRRTTHRLKYPTKGAAEYQRMRLERRINSSRYGGTALPWDDAVADYLAHFDREGKAASTRYESERTLRLFARATFPRTTADLTQRTVDFYIDERRQSLGSAWSVQKDVQRLKTFARWLAARSCHWEPIQWPKIRAQPVEKHALRDDQIRQLLAACETPAWRMRVLLSLCTGLRSKDVDALRVSDIDLEAGAIATRSTKTGKRMPRRPLPDALMPHLKTYAEGICGDKLFSDVNVRKAWESLRERAGLPHVTRQDLRVTFSTLMQRIGAEHSTVRLLEHSDPRVTKTWYTDNEVMDKLRVNLLPVDDWLSA